MTANGPHGVAVVGSANLDIVVTLDRNPNPGETVFGRDYAETPGGKGANQAIAAARLTQTSLIGMVGKEPSGSLIISHLASYNVDATHVRETGTGTGRAFIAVTPDGENSITVLPLANAALTADTVTASLRELRAMVVLAQCEIPPDAVEAAAAWCAATETRFVFNPSPVTAITADALSRADPLIVNENEARAILEPPGADQSSKSDLARALLSVARSVVLTAGGEGAFVAEDHMVTRIPGLQVTVVDTTGAGDEFAGSLAAHLSLGTPLLEAAAAANAAAAQIVGLPRAAR
jgi:ribokinase